MTKQKHSVQKGDPTLGEGRNYVCYVHLCTHAGAHAHTQGVRCVDKYVDGFPHNISCDLRGEIYTLLDHLNSLTRQSITSSTDQPLVNEQMNE